MTSGGIGRRRSLRGSSPGNRRGTAACNLMEANDQGEPREKQVGISEESRLTPLKGRLPRGPSDGRRTFCGPLLEEETGLHPDAGTFSPAPLSAILGSDSPRVHRSSLSTHWCGSMRRMQPPCSLLACLVALLLGARSEAARP